MPQYTYVGPFSVNIAMSDACSVSRIIILLYYTSSLQKFSLNNNYSRAIQTDIKCIPCTCTESLIPFPCRFRIISKSFALASNLFTNVNLQFLNVTGISLGHGIATASDTLSSQVHFNAHEFKPMCLHLA